MDSTDRFVRREGIRNYDITKIHQLTPKAGLEPASAHTNERTDRNTLHLFGQEGREPEARATALERGNDLGHVVANQTKPGIYQDTNKQRKAKKAYNSILRKVVTQG
jgi:hypothetical protein